MPTLQELFKTKQLPSQNGKTAEEAYDIQNSKDIRISSSNALVSATGLAGANLLRKTLGVRGSETLLEEEVVGVRIIRGLSIPVIYGSDLPRLLLKTTPALSAMKSATSGELIDTGAIGGTIASAASSVKKALGFPTLATPTYVVNELNKKTHTLKGTLFEGKDDFGSIKASADGIPASKLLGFVGGLLQGGNLKTIGRQALGSAIKLGKKEISKKLFGKPDRKFKDGNKVTGTIVIGDSLTGFTQESIDWWRTTNINYGPDITKTPDKDPLNVDVNMNNAPYSTVVKPKGDTPSERNDLSHKQKLDYEYLNEFRTSGGDVNPIRFSTAPERFKKFNPTGTDGTPYDADYKNKYIGSKRGMDVPSTDPIGKDGKNPSVNDSINLQTYWDEAKNTNPDIQNLDNIDFATLRFTSIPTKKSVQFRATISGLSETVSPSWDSAKFVGSPFSYHTYSGIERSITFNFKIFSLSIEEHKVAWEKLDFLTGLTYPAGYYDTSAIKPPFIKFTLGDMYKNKESFIDSLSYTIDDNTPWEVEEKGYILPTIIDTSLTIKFVEARNNTEKRYSYTSTPQT